MAVRGKSDYADWFRRDPVVAMRDQPGSPLDRVTKTKQVLHIPDLRLDQSISSGNSRIVVAGRLGRRTHACRRAHAQGRRAHRHYCHLSPGGTAVHALVDRVAYEFRCSSRDRHREYAPAQRAAGIAAAANRHRRRAQGHQPLDVRSAEWCSIPWSSWRGGFPRLIMAWLFQREGEIFRGVQALAMQQRCTRASGIISSPGRSRWIEAVLPAGPRWRPE